VVIPELLLVWVSPLYFAVMVSVPRGNFVVVRVAVPALNVFVPSVVVPLLNTTLPVGPPGALELTVAVSVTACP
jgi:hypothetical protein